MRLHIDDLILYRGNEHLEYGASAAFWNHFEGRTSRSFGKPIVVKYLPAEEGFIVLDGHHRIVSGLIDGEEYFDCTEEGSEDHKYWVPDTHRRFQFTMSGLRHILRNIIQNHLL